jgi:dTDP-3,4-didehydro-2,6-dideoxy-alpha-D-glucose 3-reductase
MKRLRIGVLGCANIAKRSMIPAIKSIEGFELVAVASQSEDKAKEFAKFFNCEPIVGYQNILDRDDIEIIYMPLPTGLHEEWVMKALDKGKHIHIEKSLAMNYASAQNMVAKAKDRGLLIMENFMFLYHGQHQFIRDMIADGEIGDIRCFRSSFGFPPLNKDNFRYKKSLGGGALLDAAAYTIRVSQLFLGKNLRIEGASLVYKYGAEVDIFGGAFLINDNGVFSEIAFGFDNFYQCNYEILGSKGKIIAERAFTPGPDLKPVISLERKEGASKYHVDAENHFVNILNEFRRCIIDKDFDSKYEEILNQSRLIQELRDKSQAKHEREAS